MAKRVSLKGKGADLFFGDYAPSGEPTTLPRPTGADDPDPASLVAGDEIQPVGGAASVTALKDVEQARTRESAHASKNARKKDSAPAFVHASKQERENTSALSTETLNAIWHDVMERATLTNAFRYTDRELSDLTDVIYAIGKRYGLKLTKQDVARLGLNVVLWDYQTNGDDSLLGQLVFRKKQQQAGD